MKKDDDFFDDYWEYVHFSGDYGGGDFPGDYSSEIFKIVIIGIAVIVVLALLLGIGIPGAVWGFFSKIILVVGFFALLGFLGSKK